MTALAMAASFFISDQLLHRPRPQVLKDTGLAVGGLEGCAVLGSIIDRAWALRPECEYVAD